MPLRAERILRVSGVAAVVGLAIVASRPPHVPAVLDVGGMPSNATIIEWIAVPPAETVVVRVAAPPDDTSRTLLAALAAAGTAVRWVDGGLAAEGLEAEADVGTRTGLVRVVGGVARDGWSTLGDGESVRVPGLIGPVRAGTSWIQPELVPTGRALVIGPAGWEARFVVAGLEAAGWRVRTALQLAPGLSAGTIGVLARDNPDVVVVLGAIGGPDAQRLRRYVAEGGGLVLAPAALETPALASIAPGRAAARVRPAASVGLPAARSDLVWRPVHALGATAVPLESDTAAVRIAAHRVASGRVVQVAEEESWRWALASEAGRTGHAAFWAHAAEAARYRPAAERPLPGDPAPTAAFHAAFGAALGPGAAFGRRAMPWEAILATLAFGLLLAEWAVRRSRGRP